MTARLSRQASALLVLGRRHWLIAALLAAGAALRVITQLAYQPALLYIDSFSYLTNLGPLRAGGSQPIGYVLLLRPLVALGGLAFVAAAQHLLGLAMGLGVYLLLVRAGARRWVAGLAAAPVLLDAYQLQIEQNVMADTLFEALLVLAVAALLWRRPLTAWSAALAGLSLGAAAVTRLVGEPLILAALAFTLLAVAGLRRKALVAGALVGAFAAPLVGYMLFTQAQSGSFGVSGASTRMLYGRLATVVDCAKLDMPAYERPLCPTQPVGQRMTDDDFANSDASPLYSVATPPGMTTRQVVTDFNNRVLAAQPAAVAAAIGRDTVKVFAPTRVTSPGDVLIDRWRFTTTYPEYPPNSSVAMTTALGEGPTRVNTSLAVFLRRYQLDGGYTSGPALALALALGVLGALGATKAARRSGLRAACALPTLLGVGALLVADVFEFSWRYQLPALTLLPLAGGLGLTALARRGRPLLAPYPDPVDEAARAEFCQREGEVSFAPVVVLIAAYNEADGIGPVLDAIPPSCAGLAVDRLVVADGCADATAEVATAHGAHVCVAPVNRGQGAALRLGYGLARAGGARIIVTTDADGQYEIAELPALLAPLLAGEADFVTGSRVLGRAHGADPVRALGTRVFAWLVTLLTGTPITDTSFGFRAMRAEVTGVVTLSQPQYQSSELLIGVLGRGLRVREQPLTMHQRNQGRSKKGNNLLYGARYARVVLRTWLREWTRRAVRPGYAASSPAVASASGRLAGVASAPAAPAPVAAEANTTRSNSANLTTNITP